MAAYVAIAVLALVVFLALRAAVTEQGPNPWLVLLRRYSVWPWAFGLAALVTLVGLAVPPWRTTTLIALGVAAWWLLCLSLWQGWHRGTAFRALRRLVLRARWPSVARASGAGTTKDRRSRKWPGGTTVTIGSEAVEYLPTIAHGRALPDGAGVRYVVRPARGTSLATLKRLELELAAGLKVAEVVVNDRTDPYKGQLDVYWVDTLARTVEADDEELAS